MQIEWSEGGCRSWRESSRRGEEKPAHLCKNEAKAGVSLSGGRKEIFEGNGDALRRDAGKRADRAACGEVISCSRDQERWRTELELCRGESFDDDHRSAALGTAPQRVGGWCGRGFRFGLWWNCVESS